MKKVIKASLETELSINDGWNTDIESIEELQDCLNETYRLQYEIENGVRGIYTKCYTLEDLGNYVIELGERLERVGNYILEEE